MHQESVTLHFIIVLIAPEAISTVLQLKRTQKADTSSTSIHYLSCFQTTTFLKFSKEILNT